MHLKMHQKLQLKKNSHKQKIKIKTIEIKEETVIKIQEIVLKNPILNLMLL
jgi:hypothetical protein